MSECPHYLEIYDVAMFECERPLGHKKKHACWAAGDGVGPSHGGKARKRIAVKIEWGRSMFWGSGGLGG